MDRTRASLRLLLVDDEEEFLSSTAQALSRRGFDVSTAPNGVSAMELVDEQAFDVIVLDVKMPDISGIELFDYIRTRLPETPIIILTGHPSVTDAFNTSRLGVADYLSKPVDMEELAQKAAGAVSDAERKSVRQTENMRKPIPRINLLAVDSEMEFLDSLKQLLAKRGINTITSKSSHTALEILKEQPVDVVILDVELPGMRGIDVLRRIKGLYPGIQVILLSGQPSEDAAIEGSRLGAGEYMKKPPDIDELVDAIVRLHRKRMEALEKQQHDLVDEIRRRYTD
jgi:DNA-binding NtrC family response regulator